MKEKQAEKLQNEIKIEQEKKKSKEDPFETKKDEKKKNEKDPFGEN